MSFRNSGYRPLTPCTPMHSPHPSVSSARSRTPGQLSMHEYRKLQASPSPIAAMGQKSLKRKQAVSRLQVHDIGDEKYGFMGVVTAPSTPMQDRFAGVYDDTQDGARRRAQPRDIELHTPGEYAVPAFDFEISPPPSPDSPPTHYSRSSDLSPLLPFITSATPSRGLYSSALAFSRPSSILHHSLHDHTSSNSESLPVAEARPKWHSSAESPQLKPSNLRHFKSAKRLPRPDLLNSSSATPSPHPIPSISSPPAGTSNESSPFTLTPFQFPDPPSHRYHPQGADCIAVHKPASISSGFTSSEPHSHSDQTGSFSDLLHLYGTSFELINRHKSFQSEHLLSSPADEGSASTESMLNPSYTHGRTEPENSVWSAWYEVPGREPVNSTVEQVIDLYQNELRHVSRVTHSTAGHPPAAAPPDLPGIQPLPLFSGPMSLDETPVVDQATDELLQWETSSSGDESLEWARQALSQNTANNHRSTVSGALEGSLETSLSRETFHRGQSSHTGQSHVAQEHRRGAERYRAGESSRINESLRDDGVFSTPVPLRRRRGLYFEPIGRRQRLPERPPSFSPEASYHSPADYPEHLLSGDPNSQIDTSRLSDFMTTIEEYQEMSDVARGKMPMGRNSSVEDSCVTLTQPRRNNEPASTGQTEAIELQPLPLGKQKTPPKVQHNREHEDARLEVAREVVRMTKRSAHYQRHGMASLLTSQSSSTTVVPRTMRPIASSGYRHGAEPSFPPLPTLPPRVYGPKRYRPMQQRSTVRMPNLAAATRPEYDNLVSFNEQYKLSLHYLLYANIPGICFVALFYYTFWGLEKFIEERTGGHLTPRAKRMHHQHRKYAAECLIGWILAVVVATVLAAYGKYL